MPNPFGDFLQIPQNQPWLPIFAKQTYETRKKRI